MTGVTMTKEVISESLRKDFLGYLKRKRKLDLISNYLYFVSKKYDIHPIVSPKHRMIFRNLEEALEILESEGKIWRETQVRIGDEQAHVNEQTKKIYICPFSGKVFADNTHPNPQDAIYDWVAHSPLNKERKDGLVVKRFFVSEDPEMIKNYIVKTEEPITKTVFSSVLTGALYNSKEVILEEFKKDFIKPIHLEEIQNQNRYELEDKFLHFVQDELAEEKVTQFIEALSEYIEFLPYIQLWLED